MGAPLTWCGRWPVWEKLPGPVNFCCGGAAGRSYHRRFVGGQPDVGQVLFGRNVSLTGNSFLLTCSGVVKAGVEGFEAVEVRIDDEAATIDVTVPRVKVTSSEIAPDSITVCDQSMNPFNQIEMQDFSNFIAEEKRVAGQKAVGAGLLGRAEDRVKMLMVSHVEALTGGTQ